MFTPQQWLQEILTATEALLSDGALNHQQITFVENIYKCAEILQNNHPEMLYNIPIKYIPLEFGYESRSVLTPIKGYSNMLLEYPEQFGGEELNTNQKQSLTLIQDNIGKFSDWKQLIIETAEITRLQMHNAPSQKTNLNQLLTDHIPLYQYLLREYHVELAVEYSQNLPLVMANPYHLSHLIKHIILTIATELIEKGEIHLFLRNETNSVVISIFSPMLQLTTEALDALFQKQGCNIYRQRLKEQGGHIHIPSQSKIDLYLTKS